MISLQKAFFSTQMEINTTVNSEKWSGMGMANTIMEMDKFIKGIGRIIKKWPTTFDFIILLNFY